MSESWLLLLLLVLELLPFLDEELLEEDFELLASGVFVIFFAEDEESDLALVPDDFEPDPEVEEPEPDDSIDEPEPDIEEELLLSCDPEVEDPEPDSPEVDPDPELNDEPDELWPPDILPDEEDALFELPLE